MEHSLLSPPTAIHNHRLGQSAPAGRAQDERHYTGPRHQYHARIVPYRHSQKYSWSTEAGPDRTLQAGKRHS